MGKQILFFLASLSAFLFGGLIFHEYYLNANQLELSYSLLKVYIFHSLASFIVYILVLLTYNWRSDQAGYVFLVGVFVKTGLFVLIFNASIFQKEQLLMFERVSLLIPFMVILCIEALFVSRILSAKKEEPFS